MSGPATVPGLPAGYRRDALGRLVPEELIRPVDLLRDETVRELVARAEALHDQLKQAKREFFATIDAFVELSAERFEVAWGGSKGNISLVSFDGSHRVLVARDEYLSFDERLQVAKELVDACLHAWSEGARAELRTLVTDAFQVDKVGRVNTRRILSLRRLKIDDPTWQRAMAAIEESLQVVGSRAYVRVYRRGADGGWEQLSLDFSSV